MLARIFHKNDESARRSDLGREKNTSSKPASFATKVAPAG
jgi:hypothetical protein